MKKLLLFFISLMILGCSADNAEKPEEQSEEQSINETSLTIKNTETIKYKVRIMEAIPVEGGPQITKQPEHYLVSELIYEGSAIYYLYTPEAGFTGTETVEITHYFHNGAEVYDEEVIKLTIEVTE